MDPLQQRARRGGEHRRRCRVTGALVLCLLSAMPAGVSRAAEPVFDIDIPAMNAAEALNRLAEQTGSVMLFSYDLARAREANAVRGRYTLLEGLELLLRDTGLSGGLSEKRVVVIAESGNVPDGKGESVKKRSMFAGLAAILGVGTGNALADQDSDTHSITPLGEVVVTAQKREERLQDVPVPVTALSAQTLVSTGQLGLQDYYSRVPSLGVATSSVGGYQLLSIRGITTGLANPAVGVTIDDVPYGSSTLYGGNVPADVDPSDLERVEVLRGPQGTLYGASSIGGLIKFVTVEPSLGDTSGNFQAGVETTNHGSDLGYTVRASFNAPLSETWAIRGSAFSRQDPGYTDNPVLGKKDVNRVQAFGGHLSTLWRPSDVFSLKLSALVQDVDANGSPDVNLEVNGYVGPPLGPWEQNYIPGAGAYTTKIQAYSATAQASFGKAELTSVTGYNINEYTNHLDFTYIFGPFTDAEFPGYPGSRLVSDVKLEKFSQEFRLLTPIGSHFEWLLGAFYTDERNSPFVTTLLAEHPTTGAIGGTFGVFDQPSTFEEYAGFTDLTIHFTPQFDLQVGARWSHISQTNQETDSGPFVPLFEGVPSPNVGPEFRSNDDADTYLLTPRWKVSPDLMIYARLASGYRAGGPNPVIGVPPQYGPDNTYNYELGLKVDALAGAMSFDASIYHIDWKDMQFSVSDPVSGISWTANAGAAKSEGVELSLNSRPWNGMNLSGWVAWNEAELTDPLPPRVPGSSCDRLCGRSIAL